MGTQPPDVQRRNTDDAVINSLVVAVLVVLASFPGPALISGLSALGGFIVSAALHALAIRSSYKSSERV